MGKESQNLVLDDFSTIHQKSPFDIIEGPDYGADALEIKKKHPEIPYTVKLHTPKYIIRDLNKKTNLSLLAKIRFTIGALRRGRIPKPHGDNSIQKEKEAIKIADNIAAPSKAIGKRIARDLQIDPKKIRIVPYPYIPSKKLLEIPIKTNTQRVTFIGRLEFRKGVLDLAKAIPAILRSNPKIQFRFIGRSMSSPKSGTTMQKYIEKQLKPYASNIEFIGHQPPEKITKFLSETDICIFPSHWESFGLVCCESMAAGRATIGTNAGGMPEVIGDGGIIIETQNPKLIAEKIVNLFKKPEERFALGKKGRKRVLTNFGEKAILPLQISCYEDAISKI